MRAKKSDPATKRRAFSATLIQAGKIDATYVEVPFSVEKVYGTRGQVKVNAWIDGTEYRGSLANMGGGCHILIVIQAVRRKIGKGAGDTVEIILERDTAKRVVKVPRDFRSALAKSRAAGEFFAGLSFTCRKEYVQWIESAKKEETRARRIASAVKMLLERKKNP